VVVSEALREQPAEQELDDLRIVRPRTIQELHDIRSGSIGLRWGVSPKLRTACEHDQQTQQTQVEQENQVIQQAVDAGEGHGVVSHAREEKHDRQEGLGEGGSNLGGRQHAGSPMNRLRERGKGRIGHREA